MKHDTPGIGSEPRRQVQTVSVYSNDIAVNVPKYIVQRIAVFCNNLRKVFMFSAITFPAIIK